MPDEKIKSDLIKIARVVKGSELTFLESIRISNRFDESRGSTKERVVVALSASLEIEERQILVKLAANDDTDRIITDIDNILKNK